ncbi:hypothetical protein SELMODRAFT_437809 [Selaginella moellendorffii]|uniref:Uncharacterized protein n=1 Tax=Selaginella moellendorffii TaxID=88036 RepID=D8QTV9_SELML|nr:hypothetical protein SELMODRAFT_437809 [Selaginella moellendorffii]
MSRCHPYPPPGYEKKATTELIADIVPAAQVATSKEKHKHRDKEKKKKRKRDDKNENNSPCWDLGIHLPVFTDKDKRSSKNQKTHASSNDVSGGENGRLQAAADSKSATGSTKAGKGLQDAKLSDRVTGTGTGWQEAKAPETGKAVLQEAKATETGKVLEARSSSSTQILDGSSNSKSNSNSKAGVAAAVASTSKYVVTDTEINGKVPLVMVKPLDTGQVVAQQQGQQHQHHQDQKIEDYRGKREDQKRENDRAKREDQTKEDDRARREDQKKEDGRVRREDQEQKQDTKKKSPPSVEKEKEKEKRHRFPEIKLAEIKEERLEEDDAHLEWLYHKRRRDEGKKPREEKEREEEDEVWAEARFLPAVGVYALPYVVPY